MNEKADTADIKAKALQDTIVWDGVEYVKLSTTENLIEWAFVRGFAKGERNVK